MPTRQDPVAASYPTLILDTCCTATFNAVGPMGQGDMAKPTLVSASSYLKGLSVYLPITKVLFFCNVAQESYTRTSASATWLCHYAFEVHVYTT